MFCAGLLSRSACLTSPGGVTARNWRSVRPWTQGGSVKLKLDLHDIYNRGDEIERALQSIMDEAVAKKAPLVEIIPGKGSGAFDLGWREA